MRHGGVFVVQVLDLVGVRQVADAEHAVQSEVGDIDVDVVGDVGGQALDFDFAENLVEDAAAGLDAERECR